MGTPRLFVGLARQGGIPLSLFLRIPLSAFLGINLCLFTRFKLALTCIDKGLGASFALLLGQCPQDYAGLSA